MDIVSVGLRVKDDGTIAVKAFGEASEKAAKRIEELERQLNRLGGAHGRAAGAGEGHRLATGKVSRALEGLITSSIGANHHLGAISVALSDMALGGIVVTGVLAGLAAISFAFDKLTESSRKAMEQGDKLIETYIKAARIRALGVGGEQRADIEDINSAVAAYNQRASFFSGVAAMLGGSSGVGGIFSHIAGGYAAQVGQSSKAQQEAVNQLGLAIAEVNNTASDKAKETADKAATAWKKVHDQEVRFALETQTEWNRVNDVIAHGLADAVSEAYELTWRPLFDQIKTGAEDAVASAVAVFHKGTGKQLEDRQAAIERQADQEKGIVENLVRSMQDTWSTFFDNIFERGVISFKSLFDEIKRLFLKMIADLLAAGVMRRLVGVLGGLFGMPQVAGAQGAGGVFGSNAWSAGGKMLGAGALGLGVGTAIGQMSGSATGGAIGGGLGGAAAGFAVAGPVGAFIGGVTGLVSGLLSGASAAREAAAAMRQLKKDYESATSSFRKDDLATQLAQNAAAAEQLRSMASKIFGDIMTLVKDWGAALKKELKDIADQEARNAEQLKRQAAEQAQYRQEDLIVRNLRATGHSAEADKLAFKNQQDREYQAALDRAMADGLLDATEALYLNTLRTTQNNELLAFQNGLLQDAVRNAPSGFFVNSYLSEFAHRDDVFDRPGRGPKGPLGPGTSTPTAPVTFSFDGATFEIKTDGTPEETFNGFIGILKQKASATLGPQAPLSKTLDRL